MFELDLNYYTDAGRGYCDDGSGLTFPSVYFKTSDFDACKLACDKLKHCIAFDINNNENCNMRFLSTASAITSGGESGYHVWDQGCRNNCKATIMGKQFYEEQGRCYIKNKGIYLTIPCDHDMINI